MSAYYTFVCSLPYLSFDSEVPMMPEEFLDRASFYLGASEMSDLTGEERVSDIGAAWDLWERSFRTAVASIRAGRTGKEFQPDRTKTDILDGVTRQTVADLYKTEAPMKIERGLDLLRFSKLDELSCGHNFDYAVIFCYYQKLRLMWRWKGMDKKSGEEVVKNCCEVK